MRDCGQGKAVAAEKSYLQALQTYQECLGDGRGETGDTLYQLASLYQKQVKYRQAAQYFGAAATAYAKAFGDTDKYKRLVLLMLIEAQVHWLTPCVLFVGLSGE